MAMRWYIVHAYSNFEKKVAESIREGAAQRGLAEAFEEILVPTEQVVEVRRGRKVSTERKFFPGYVLVKCNLTDPVFSLINPLPHGPTPAAQGAGVHRFSCRRIAGRCASNRSLIRMLHHDPWRTGGRAGPSFKRALSAAL